MWKRFLCWSLGHKTMVKAFTGNVLGIDQHLLYKWQREKYCVRCGIEVWNEKQEQV